jgi:threonylcarbamoyladenosine tRNA methylthiotransferase MtaB
MQINNKTFCITTLGCRTNICESNIISDQLINNGAKITDDIDNADVCIVNTCCVTKRAEIKSHYFIKRAIRSPKCKLIVIVGCLPQISYKVFNHPKIGIILGTKDKTSLVNYIQKYERNNRIVNVTNFQNNDVLEKYQIVGKSNNTRAFMKIQDGCNFMCSYCIIPFVRGRQRSLPHNEIMKMIQSFVNKGYKEIVLTGVNTAGYQDKNNYKFLDLLKDIDNLDGNFRIRISSLEPFQINHTIIDLMTTNPKR